MNPSTQKPLVAECPSCDTKIRFTQSPKIGEDVTCSECGEVLQVVSLSPLELDWAYDDDDYEEYDDEDDDWGYEEEDYEEYDDDDDD